MLALGFAAVIACMLTSMFVFFQQLEIVRETRASDAMISQKLQSAFKMREAIRQRSFRLTVAITLDDFFDRDEQRLIANNVAADFVVARQSLEALIVTNAERTALRSITERIREARPTFELAMNEIVERGYDPVCLDYMREAIQGQSRLFRELDHFVALVQAESDVNLEATNLSLSETRRDMIVLSSGIVFLALMVGMIVLVRESHHKRFVLAHREQLAQLSFTDSLTGIANRRRFDEFFDHAWHQATRSHLPLTLILIDVDHFKLYNDEYGHAKGDECLVAITGAISNIVSRQTDLAARIGGEEFACVLPDTNIAGAKRIAGRIRRAVAALAIEHNRSSAASVVTVSLGVATRVPIHTDSAAKLFDTADQLLYKAKLEGRNRIVANGTDRYDHVAERKRA
ncbi:MAG: diguanylate cyclase [Hyphomicrobiales bacterium]|nr:diguanylate cyclase [Hyphomicrobiales bacterium]